MLNGKIPADKYKFNPSIDQPTIVYVILWFMVSIYPLIVIPNNLNYFYAPRYLVLIVISVLTLYVIFRERIKVFHPVLIPAAFFLAFVIISTLLAENKAIALIGSPHRLTGLTTVFFCMILFLIAFANKTPGKKILLPMIVTAAVVSVLAVMQYFGLNIVPHEPFRDNSIRGYSTMGNPNFLGTYTAFILPAAILFYLKDKKIVLLICTGVIYAGLLVSLTRGVWIASFLTFVILFIYAYRLPGKRKALGTVILVLFLVTAFLLPAQDGLLFKRIFTVSDQMQAAVQLEDKAGSGRMFIWKETMQLLPQYWAFGIGPDNLGLADIHTPNGTLVDKTHNIYLEIAVTMGIFALLSYLAFLAYFLKPREGFYGFLYFIMITTYLLQGFFNIDVIMVWPLFWIVLGLSLAHNKFSVR